MFQFVVHFIGAVVCSGARHSYFRMNSNSQVTKLGSCNTADRQCQVDHPLCQSV